MKKHSHGKKITAAAATAAVLVFALLLWTGGAQAVAGADWHELVQTLENGGSYMLTGDIKADFDGSVNIAGSGAELDLNGHQISVSGNRDADADLFRITGSLTVSSTEDSGLIRSVNGRSVFGVLGGQFQMKNAYVHGDNVDHIVFSENGQIDIQGGKLFGVTTGNTDGGGICLLGESSAAVDATVIQSLDARYGGGIYVSSSSTLASGGNARIETCFASQECGGVYYEKPIKDPSLPDMLDCTALIGSGDTNPLPSPWDELKQAVLSGQEYVLFEDIEDVQNDTITVQKTGAKIDFNGHTCKITGSAPTLFQIAKGAELTLADTSGLDEEGWISFTGRGIRNSGSLMISGGGIQDCATEDEGAGVYSTGSVVMSGGTIRSCSANTFGGGIYAESGTVTISGGIINGCSAAASGGGIHVEHADATLSGSGIIRKCTAPDGAGVFVEMSDGSFEMSGSSKVEECSAARNGGGIYVWQGSTSLADSALIRKCDAVADGAGNGGAIYLGTEHAEGSMSGQASIEDCEAAYGGGVDVFGGTFTESGKAIIASCRARYGGGIYVSQTAGRITVSDNASVQDCTAAMSGAGICADTGSTLVMQGSASVSSCEALKPYGGGVSVYTGATANIANSVTITDNNGYGIYVWPDSTLLPVKPAGTTSNTPDNIAGYTETP